MATRDRRLGTVIAGRFKVISLLGEGQMARVYVAEQLSMKRKVALKILHPELNRHPSAPARFRREVEAVVRLRSPHTIVFHDFGQADDGALFIAMELLPGESLRSCLERAGALDPWLVLTIVRQLAGCLAEAHACGVLHRDLKPENIFLCPSDPFSKQVLAQTPQVKVLDFGLAKLSPSATGTVPEAITAPSMTVGTPAYLAPEAAIAGKTVDARADLYALGVLAFEMLCGRPPYQARTPHEMLQAHASSPIPQPSRMRAGLPRGCDGFIAVAMAKGPDERFQKAEALASALAAALGERRVG
jgi:serine/threonine-protein kinase